jgi:hypothetical protein
MPLTRKVYATRNEKIIDFAIGFVGWFIINGVLYACLVSLYSRLPTADSQGSVAALMLLALPLLINIGLLVLLAFMRRWIAFGALAAFGLLLLGGLLLGLLIYATCYTDGNMFR